MKVKYILMTVIFLLGSTSAFSQDATAGTMIKQKSQTLWADAKPVFSNGAGTYYLLIPYSSILSVPMMGGASFHSIGFVNHNSEMEKLIPLEFKNGKKEGVFSEAVSFNDNLWIFSSFQNKDEIILSTYSLDTDKQELIKENEKVMSIDASDLKYDDANFTFEVSPDQSKILINYTLVDSEGYTQSFGYSVFDENMKEIRTWNGTLDMSDGVYQLDQFRVSNTGDVYLLTRYFSDNQNLKNSTDLKRNGLLSSSKSLSYSANYEIRLVLFKNGKTDNVSLTVPDKFFISADFITGQTGLIVAGFYGPKGTTTPEGAAVMRLNDSGNVIKLDKKTLPDGFEKPSNIEDKSNGLMSNDNQYDAYRFTLKDLIVKEDGGYILSGERTVNQQKKESVPGHASYSIVNHTDDIAVVDIQKDGTIKSIYRIEKAQETTALETLSNSYYITELNGSIYCLFTNIGKSNKNFTGKMVDTKAVLVKIDESGELSRDILLTSDQTDVTIRPQATYLNDNNELILYGHKNNRFCRFLKVSL